MSESTPDGGAERTYRGGIEKAMSIVWREKSRHSVVSEAYFALKKVWDELYVEAAAEAAVRK
jgi:hypothetical protein